MSAFFNLKYLYSGKLCGETVKAYLMMQYAHLAIDQRNQHLCLKKEDDVCVFIAIRSERVELYSSISPDCMRRCKRFLYIPYSYFRISGRQKRDDFLKEVTNYLQLRFGE